MTFIRQNINIWLDIPDESFKLTKLTAATTNEIFIIGHEESTTKGAEEEPNKLLVRIYGEGSENIIDRREELKLFEKLSSLGIGPKLIASFNNGRIEEYIESKVLTAEMMRRADISIVIAKRLAQFHQISMLHDGDAEVIPPVLWERLESWRLIAKDALKKNKLIHFSDSNETINLYFEHNFIDELFHKIFPLGPRTPIALCHNDLQHGNIILSNENKSVVFIDYEYGGINYAAFDIANHFCEWASDFNSSTPHVMDFDRKYPSKQEQIRFLNEYLTGDLNNNYNHHNMQDKDLDIWLEEIEGFTQFSHLLWGYWGIIQAANSSIDFDYLSYALMRFNMIKIPSNKQ